PEEREESREDQRAGEEDLPGEIAKEHYRSISCNRPRKIRAVSSPSALVMASSYAPRSSTRSAVTPARSSFMVKKKDFMPRESTIVVFMKCLASRNRVNSSRPLVADSAADAAPRGPAAAALSTRPAAASCCRK